MDVIDQKCQIIGCKNGGAMMDGDGILKCQEHLVEAAFSGTVIAPKKKKIQRNDPCSCESGLKFKKCCGNFANEHRQWFLQNIGRTLWYKDGVSPCPEKDCDNCKKWEKGVKIQNQKHARMLFEFARKRKVQFQLTRPEKDKLKIVK